MRNVGSVLGHAFAVVVLGSPLIAMVLIGAWVGLIMLLLAPAFAIGLVFGLASITSDNGKPRDERSQWWSCQDVGG